ncbi:hypothetical protein AUQ37_08475 [Candidatus Methanomethylophilus sp. 1R26]|uniref:hypothetical protein n=1 Tax=Candidatus Methanomethylophilus sp. 1R26 TaxID=1769296 RepID=UPI0007376D00|nr:hypothetical protein [Candidatus Methanomethylophilus sp. 1R26]KUE73546.1 hypothetical protein AUQ37_08475 [Candidatus Methanomethylophilus sp. 1R26]MEE3401102.1 hypothetical protein [Methanomethylophilus sp.]TQS78995.1 MAG: hypothetical protein A3Q59_01445 [Methanomethylophilus alvi]WII09365.1 hypothetical protein O8W32_00705 [Methanomassiliicoccales archaeon LGM-DZ1]
MFSIAFGDNKNFAGTVSVTLPYALRDGEDAGRIYVAFVNPETNKLESMSGTWSDGYVTFATDHFSDYAVMHSEPSDDSGSSTLLFVGIGIAAAIAVLFIALYFLHIGPFARKD